MLRHFFRSYIICFVILLLPVAVQANENQIAGETFAITVSNSHVYLGVGQQLVIFDVSDSRAPDQVGKASALGDSIQDIEVEGNLAYLAVGEAGLQIFDVSNPSAPVIISRLKLDSETYALHVMDGYAYVTGDWDGLLIFDISDPAYPTLVAEYDGSATAEDIFVSDGYAYLASGEEGLHVVDIRDPANPVGVGQFPTSNDARGIFVDGGYAYLAAGSMGLRILDISNPAKPVEVASDDQGYARRVHVDAGHVYIAAERSGVFELDVTDPINPERIQRYMAHGAAHSVNVGTENIYVAEGKGGLLILKPSSDQSAEWSREFLAIPNNTTEN